MLLDGKSLPNHIASVQRGFQNDNPPKENKDVISARKKTSIQSQHPPHATVHAALVLDAPCVRGRRRDDLLTVAQFATSGEVLSAPCRLEVERLVSARALKGPLKKCERDVTGMNEGALPLDWVRCGTRSR